MNIALNNIAEYYQDKLQRHGETAQGVDWNSQESQWLRFKQLSQVINANSPFTINDIGCGFGSYYNYLAETYRQNFHYFGQDISKEMIRSCQNRLATQANVSLSCSNELENIADYSIASGIFNIRLQVSDDDWLQHILNTLTEMNQNSEKGFAFNCLTKYSDKEKMKDYLYYADPLFLFDFCKQNFSSQVALLHDYGLYEFTIIVRKSV